MNTGTVKWFNAQKGFGFIQPTNGSNDVFVHISAVERAGMGTLNEGQTLSYRRRRRPSYGQVRRRKSSCRCLIKSTTDLSLSPRMYWQSLLSCPSPSHRERGFCFNPVKAMYKTSSSVATLQSSTRELLTTDARQSSLDSCAKRSQAVDFGIRSPDRSDG